MFSGALAAQRPGGEAEPRALQACFSVGEDAPGAAYAAGYAVGFWSSTDEMRNNRREDKRWQPDAGSNAGTELYAQWKKAVTRTFDWVD